MSLPFCLIFCFANAFSMEPLCRAATCEARTSTRETGEPELHLAGETRSLLDFGDSATGDVPGCAGFAVGSSSYVGQHTDPLTKFG